MRRLPEPAWYLLRIDDLTPSMNREAWSVLCGMIRQFGLRPILAVVPDNQDRGLEASEPDPQFWPVMKAMEHQGAAIALHGYQHRCTLKAKSLLPLHRHSEFAGLSLNLQREKIRAGVEILRSHGLTPKLFVAPRHSFDGQTLVAA